LIAHDAPFFSVAYRRNSAALEKPRLGDADVLPVLVLLWLASVVLVVLRILRNEPLELDGALATLIALGLPLALLRR
jgi:hypothetical protein